MNANQAMINAHPMAPEPKLTFEVLESQLRSIEGHLPQVQARIDRLEAEKDRLEAENASLLKQIDQLTDDLARAREGDL